jgi:lipopolysaccharide export system permease protein
VNRLNRYVGQSVLGAMVSVLLVLVGLDGLSALIDEADDITDTYGFIDVLWYIVLTLPRRLHEFVPFAALIGALVALGRMAGSYELTIIRAAGVSLLQLAAVVIRPALVLALAGFVVGDFIAPHTEQMALSHRALEQRDDSTIAGRHGSWNRDGNVFVHVEAVQRGGLIFDVTLLTFDDDKRLISALEADRGTFLDDHWVLENVVTTTRSADVSDARYFTTWRWDTSITPNLLILESVEPHALPVTQLWVYADHLEQQGLLNNDIQLALWGKILQPLAVAGMVLIAMSFIFGPLREGTMGARIFTGVLVGVLFRMSQDFFGPMSLLFGIPPILSALLPIAVCWLVAIVLLRSRH